MIITPQSAPAPQASGQSATQQDAKARAIAALMGSNNQQIQDVNQNNIAPEDQTALRSPTQEQRQTASDDGTTPPKEVTTAPTEEPLSTQYAQLARREKAIRAKAIAQEQSFKAREAALIAREAETTSKSTQDLSNYISIDKLKQNAFSELAKLGVTYDQLSQQAMNAQSPEMQAVQAMRDELQGELQKVREEQANSRKTYDQQQAQSYQQAVNQIRTEVNQLVKSDPSYEMTKTTNSVNDVVSLIERTFKESGELLTVEQAAQAVEDHLIEEVLKVSQTKKVQERLKAVAASNAAKAAAAAPAKEAPTQQTTGQQNNIKTLTNAVGSTRPLTAKERALLAFKNELHNK
jgi:hypothetical protein